MLPVLRCPLCGKILERRAEKAVCSYCDEVDEPREGAPLPWRCPDGHFICETCRSSEPERLWPRLVATAKSLDPYAIANLAMAHPSMRQTPYGPDHHGIPAIALLVALRNAGVFTGTDQRILAAARRGRAMPSGACYLEGGCGACIGAGAAVSTVLKLGLKSTGRSWALRAVSLSLGALAETGGLRCCKEAVYEAIGGALAVLGSMMPAAASMQRERVVCSFASDMPECKRSACPHYPGDSAAMRPE